MRYRSLFPLALIAGLAAPTSAAFAQALSFQPQRVVMDAKTGSTVLSLTNTGKRAEAYRIDLVDMIYQDDGKVVEAAKTPPGYPSAKERVRFSPSQVRLNPGETQKIRILVRQSEQPIDGEFRVHARIKQLPNVIDVKAIAAAKGQVGGMIGVEQAVAIPVIVRFGKTDATGRIAALKLGMNGKEPIVDVQLGRTGNRSLYTNLQIKDKAGQVVSLTKGIAIPVPNATRRFLMPIDSKVNPAALRGGGFTLELVDHDSGTVIDKKPIQ